MKCICSLALVAMFIVGSPISTSTSALAAAEYPECFAATPIPDIAKNPTPPSADMPRKFAKWIGVWGGGKWKDKVCAALVVLTVDEIGIAQIVHSVGDHPYKKKAIAGFRYIGNATISDDGEMLEYKPNKKHTVTYSFDKKDGKPFLNGTNYGGKTPGHATLWPKK